MALKDEGKMTFPRAYLHGIGWVLVIVGSVWTVRFLNQLYDRWFTNKEK